MPVDLEEPTTTRTSIIEEWNALVNANEDPLLAAAPPPAAADDDPFEPAPYHADADETVICPKCQKRNDDDASYCDQCGAKLAGEVGVVSDAAPDPQKPGATPAAASARFASPLAPPASPGTPPPSAAPSGPSKKPEGDVPNEVVCQQDDDSCKHLASAHADTDVGKNTGPCGMANCECPGMRVPDSAPIGDGAAAARFADPADPGTASPPPDAVPVVVPTSSTIGAAFVIPVAISEGLATSDRRMILPGALTARACPLPLMWLSTSSHGWDSQAGPAILAGRIESLAREGNNWVGAGHLLAGVKDPHSGLDLADALAQFGTMGLSADIADVSSEISIPIGPSDEGFDEAGDDMETLTAGEIMGLTVCPFPAFAGCYIMLEGAATPEVPIAQPTPEQAEMAINIVSSRDCAPCRSALPLMASAAPNRPPFEWFANPLFTGPTAMTVTEDGRVFGHLAQWGVPHIGMQGRRVLAPRSQTDYTYFLTGYVICDRGEPVPVGRITSKGGHANGYLAASAAMAHYDNTDWVACYVNAGEDDYGIWVAGAVKPGADEVQIQTLRACPPSGDWRPLAGLKDPELVGAACVNVAGFVPPARAIYDSGQLVSLIAAGVMTKERETPMSMERRLELLEGAIVPLLPSIRDGLSARYRTLRSK